MFKSVNLDKEIENMENEVYLRVMENTLNEFLTNNLKLEVEVFKSLKDNTINIYSANDIIVPLNIAIDISNNLFNEKVNENKDIFLSGRIGSFKLVDLSNDCLNTYILQLTF